MSDELDRADERALRDFEIELMLDEQSELLEEPA